MVLKERTVDLEPCCHCGQSGQLTEHINNITHKVAGYYVDCCGCHCKTQVFLKANGAVRAWNRRVKERKIKPVTIAHHPACPVCKKPVNQEMNFCQKCGQALLWEKEGENHERE